MAFDVLVTIVGEIADQGEVERLAHDIQAVVARAQGLGCIVDIRDARLGQEVQRLIALPRCLRRD